jgi:hypothetical protein
VLAGIDLPTVKELLGHANITTTMKYTRPTPAHRQSAVDVLVANETSRSLADGLFDADFEAEKTAQAIEEHGADERI